MNPIDPKVLQWAKKLYGQNCELEKTTEWSYTFRCGEKSFCSISRFLAEDTFKVNAADLRRRWSSMDQTERMEFAGNFQIKEVCDGNDAEILEIIMNDGDDVIWSTCALTLVKHPDQNRVVEFLISRIELSTSDYWPLNYMQALALLGDKRAIGAIRPYYDKFRREMEKEAAIGVPDDIFFGPIPYHAFLAVAGDLYKLDRSDEYELAVRKYFDHPSEQVRWWAENALAVEGPTTLKRNAEYRRKHFPGVDG